MAKKNKVKRSAAKKDIASANNQQCEPATPGKLANTIISAGHSINAIMENKKNGSFPKKASQGGLSDPFVNHPHTEVADSFYRHDVGGVSIVDSRNQNVGNWPNRGSESAGASPDDQIGYARIHEYGEDLGTSHGARPDRAASTTFSQPAQGRIEAHQAYSHPGAPDLGNINTSGRYNSGNPYLDWFGRRSDPLLGGGSITRDWNGTDKTSETLKDPVAPYFHPGIDLAPGTNESTSHHDNDGWASDITHHEEGIEPWRSAPKEVDGDSGGSTQGDTAGGVSKKSHLGKGIEQMDTRGVKNFGKDIQGGGNSRPGDWDWPTVSGDGNQGGDNPFTNTTAADNSQPNKQGEAEELKSWSDHIVPMRVNRAFPRRASFSLDPTFKVEESQNSPSDFDWKIENHPWPPIRPNGDSSRQKGKESAKPNDGVNPFWEPDDIEIDDFTPKVNQKEDFRAKNDYLTRREDVPPSLPRLVPNNFPYYTKEDRWANPDDLNPPEAISPRRPFMSLSDTTESCTEDQDAKAELARTSKKMDKLASQLKEQGKTAEITNDATGDAPYWEQEDYYTYTFPLWAILTGAFACFCLGMMFASGLRGTSTCIFNGGA